MVFGFLKAIYIGETGRNAHMRAMEHKRLYERKDIKSALWKHVKERHSGVEEERIGKCEEVWRFRVTEVFLNDSMRRQVNEGVLIQETPEAELVNQQDEFRRNVVARIGRV